MKPRTPYSPPAIPTTILSLNRERRPGDRVAQLRVGHFGIPAHDARLDIQRHQVRIIRADIHRVVQNRHAAIHRAAAAANALGQGARVLPQRTARQSIERRHAAAGLAQVHDAVGHQWRRLHALGGIDLIHPGRPQMCHIRAGDLIQARIAMRTIVARVRQPVAGLGIRLAQAVKGNLRGKGQGSGHTSHKTGRGRQTNRAFH